MKKLLGLLVLALVCSPAAAEVKIEGPESVLEYNPVRLKVAGKGKVLWEVYGSDGKEIDISSMTDCRLPGELWFTAPPDKYKAKVIYSDFEAKVLDRGTKYFTVIARTPPAPPTPPGPNPPGPQPPTPSPDAPIKKDGYRVLIVYDGKDTMVPEEQQEILYGQEFRDFLDTNCVVGDDKKTKERRIWPATTDVRNEAKHWQDAFALKRDSLPWIIVSNGKTGYSGPLPKDVPSALALCKKYLPSAGRN